MVGKKQVSFVIALVTAIVFMFGTNTVSAEVFRGETANTGETEVSMETVPLYGTASEEEIEDTEDIEDVDDTEDENTESEDGGTQEPETETQVPPTENGRIAEVRTIEIEYDLVTQKLEIDWTGNNIAYVDVYLDGEKIGNIKGGEAFTKVIALEALSKHECKLVPLDVNMEEGKPVTMGFQVEANRAVLDNLDVEYDEEKKQLFVSWDGKYTEYVEILLNDESLIDNYKFDEYTLNYLVLQPGATYQVTVVPYNQDGKAGIELVETLSYGEFVVPEEPQVQLGSMAIIDKNKKNTGFFRPVVEVKFDTQAGAYYEIYRAKKNKKSAYTWIASVRATENGTYTYTDKTVGTGKYYYKVLRKVVSDDYICQALYTELSEPASISIEVPRATVNAELAETGRIQLVMNADSEFVSGYVIYRKSEAGKFKKLATVSGNSYTDTDVEFDKKYRYKVRAYYYDTDAGKKVYGAYSTVEAVRNTIGTFAVSVKVLGENLIKLSWSKAANADGYEVYYKTTIKGDSYEYYATTTKLNMKIQLNAKNDYIFLVKAYREDDEKNEQFSKSEFEVLMGFANPKNLHVRKVTYGYSSKDKTFIQKNYLVWDPVYGADGYYVEKYDATRGKYVRIADLDKNSKTRYTIRENVSSDISVVSYRVCAYLRKKKLESNVVNITPRLGTPEKLKVIEKSSSAKITWSRVKEAEKYLVYRSNGRNTILVGETTKLSLTDKGLDIGVSYNYYVQAVNLTKKFTSDYSEPAECILQFSKPVKLKAVLTDDNQISLSWKEKQKARTYMIYYATEPDGEYTKLAEVDAGKLTYLHKNPKAKTTYYYKVTGVYENGVGVSVESKAAMVNIMTK